MKISISMYSLLIVFIAVSLNANAQINIKGYVKDHNTGEPLAGVVSYFPYLHKGSTTDADGKFIIKNLPSGTYDMIFSLIGYQPKVLNIKTDTISNLLSIDLSQQAFQTQEVIISGNRFSLQHENAIEIKCVKVDGSHLLKSNVLELIASTPGVDLIKKSSGIQKPVIRGLSNTNILVMDNGIRMENFQFSENHPFIVDEFGIERIEIIKGPASLLYGSDAVGGVIYMIRERPAMQNTISGDINLLYSDNDKGMISNVGVKANKNKFHTGLRIGLKSFKDFYDAAGFQIPNSRFNQGSFKSNFGFSYKKGKSDFYFDHNEMLLGLTIPKSIESVTNNNRKNEFWYQDLVSDVFVLKNKLFFDQLMIDLDISYQSNNRKLRTSEINPVFTNVDMTLNTFGCNTKLTYNFKKKHQLISGIQGMSQSNRNHDAPNHIIPDAEISDISLFLMYTSNLKDKFHILSGIRYDYRHLTTVEEVNKPSQNNDYSFLSYSAGFTWQLSEKFLFRSNFASAHRAPNLAELTQNGVHGGIYELGSSDLVTQSNYEPDLSFHFHSDFLLVELSAYYNHIDNYIFIGRTNDTTETGMTIYKYEQSDADIKGIEIGMKVMPFKFLKFFTNYSLIDAKKSAGDYLPFIPHNKIRSELQLHSKIHKYINNISLSLINTYAFKHDKIALSETEIPEYNVTDFTFSINKKINKQQFQFSISVSNIFNVSYIDNLSTLKELNYFSQGRNLKAAVKYTF